MTADDHRHDDRADGQPSTDVRPYMDAIADRLLSGHAAVMIGAGFSKNAAPPGSPLGFPDWSQLGDRFYKKLHGRSPGPHEKYLQVPALAHQVEATFGRPALDQIVRDAIPDLQHEPSSLHAQLLDLPWSDVFTTNYDTLLERAARTVISERYDLVLKPDDLGHSKRPRIVKLHGSLPSERPFIITDEDYRQYPRDFAPFVNAVRQALLENTLCLIGFSAEDVNFLQWVGWIRDNLGPRSAPKMYMVGLLQLSPSQRTLLERRNIIPVDMSACPGVDRDHYRAIQEFIRYLHHRRSANNPLDWPDTATDTPEPPNTQDPDNLVALWKDERRRYPGWVVLPHDLRSSLWFRTLQWIRALPHEDKLPGLLDIEFAFELTWRIEKCLCPLFDNHAAFLETIAHRYWPVTDLAISPESLPFDRSDAATRQLTLDAIRRKCHYILLALMRYYREEGLSAKWDDAGTRVQEVLSTLSPEHQARFHYERALSALFALNLHDLKTRLSEWRRNDGLPFWTAKKAGLLAEIGQESDAERLLEQSLHGIRTKLNLTPTQTDFTLVCQESLVMYLLHAVRQQSRLTAANHSVTRRQRQEFRERWHTLKQYKCDPWQELDIFGYKMRRPIAMQSDVTKTPAFDIGTYVQTHYLAGWNEEAQGGYNFLRFCEDAGFPFRVGNCTIATKSATGTLSRIARGSSYWALATLVRIGDTKAVDQIFDRPALARMSTPTVDRLIDRYLNALRVAVADIKTGDRWSGPSFGTLLASVLPEILSRLCCKCSQAGRGMLLAWLLDVYRSEQRSQYRGIRHLVLRLLAAFPVRERVAIVPKLLEFPILTDLNPLEKLEYINPFDVLDLPIQGAVNATLGGAALAIFYRDVSSDRPGVRAWAASTLRTLHNGGFLDPTASQRFGAALWTRVDEHGLPADTDYPKSEFLVLPHPLDVDPAEGFINYVRGTQFPAQQSQTTTTVASADEPKVALCRDICWAKNVAWSVDDIRCVVDRLTTWWDTDKEHWHRSQIRDAGDHSFLSIGRDLGTRLSLLVSTLAEMIIRYSDSINDEPTRCTVVRVATECSKYNLPALRLEIACTYVWGSPREPVLCRVEDAMASSRTEAVIEALQAMAMLSRHLVTEADREDVLRLLHGASQMIRWRRNTALPAVLGTLGNVVNKHPWALRGDVEKGVLAGLGRLVTETAICGGNGTASKQNGIFHDVSTQLAVRRAAARLAYTLFEHYRAQGDAAPGPIGDWRSVCLSDREFQDVRNEWDSGVDGAED